MKYVVTSDALTVPWQSSVVVAGDPMAGIAELKHGDGLLLQVHGSWQLIQALRAADLVDGYRLWMFPVVVGSGKRLFDGNDDKSAALQLVKSATTRGGANMAIYRRIAKS
jgi:dihydrofolate reductase